MYYTDVILYCIFIFLFWPNSGVQDRWFN